MRPQAPRGPAASERPALKARRERRPRRHRRRWLDGQRFRSWSERLLVLAADRIGEPARDRVLLVLGEPADVDPGRVDAARPEEALRYRVLDLDDHVGVVADPHQLVLARDPDPRRKRELVARSVLVEDDHRDAFGRGHRRSHRSITLAPAHRAYRTHRAAGPSPRRPPGAPRWQRSRATWRGG